MAVEKLLELDAKGLLPKNIEYNEGVFLESAARIQEAADIVRADPLVLEEILLRSFAHGYHISKPRLLPPTLPHIESALTHFQKRFHANLQWVPVIEVDEWNGAMDGMVFNEYLPHAGMDALVVFVNGILSKGGQKGALYHEWIHIVRENGWLGRDPGDTSNYEEKTCSYGTRLSSIVEGFRFPRLFLEFRSTRRKLKAACGPLCDDIFIRLPQKFLRQIHASHLTPEDIRNAIKNNEIENQLLAQSLSAKLGL